MVRAPTEFLAASFKLVELLPVTIVIAGRPAGQKEYCATFAKPPLNIHCGHCDRRESSKGQAENLVLENIIVFLKRPGPKL